MPELSFFGSIIEFYVMGTPTKELYNVYEKINERMDT